MKKIAAIVLSLVFVLSLFSLFSLYKKENKTEYISDSAVDYYIKVNNETLSKNYIGYFFYVAQETMLSEAGWNDENSTPDDIRTYWETTEIDGVNAVDAARDAAARNAVEQKVKYFKALSEGILLSESDIKKIDDYINSTVAENGGEEVFSQMLKSTGTDFESYRQITLENEYINRLYQMYIDDGILVVSDSELYQFASNNSDKYSDEEMMVAAYTSKFNTMSKDWEKQFAISINDSGMNEFTINFN